MLGQRSLSIWRHVSETQAHFLIYFTQVSMLLISQRQIVVGEERSIGMWSI